MEASISSPAREDLERFFDFLYADQVGYAYSPTKEADSERFEQYFFQWPRDKKDLIDHVIDHSPTHEVYYGPALYRKEEATKEAFGGTNFIWVEFDGNAPQSVPGDLPEPTVKIQSSESGNQHWYWKLDSFVTDIIFIEDIIRRLTYYLEGDTGCWNANRVLRPPGTVHQETQRRVTALKWELNTTVSIADFTILPEVTVQILEERDFKNVPLAIDVIAKYPWKERMDDFNFFRTKSIPKGQRSSALTKLGHICIEMGMSNAETLSMMLHAEYS